MKSLPPVWNRPLIARRTLAFGAQYACFAAALGLFVLAVRKLSTLGLSEGDLVVGLLTAVSCMLLMILIGLILPLAAGAVGVPEREPRAGSTARDLLS
ncbi:hypothetical protein [Alienimonas chondri]|uniref:ABC transporter permease n=1 Tax=Alienimonas chondri TaxID=2681879 RepID=A0ABX1VDY0_9PLAN|nr:hypothetical protein [Alienimonas chondri]NNJ26100.1 hypothetical protein [Alienimonas chondri]